ncbi:MAG TPA: hypothetical protein VJ739_13070, partial [Gemmataceae bacterium]|nr:hypothetical protein [Gemmataceae bacterium]
MTAAVHLVCGPPGSGKTRQLLARCREVARAAAEVALWLVPTYRHLFMLRERLLAEGGGGLGLHLLTFQDFAEEVIRFNDPAARPLPAVQRRLLVDALVTDLHRRGEVAHFGRVVE